MGQPRRVICSIRERRRGRTVGSACPQRSGIQHRQPRASVVGRRDRAGLARVVRQRRSGCCYRCSCRSGELGPVPSTASIGSSAPPDGAHSAHSGWEECRVERRPVIKTPPVLVDAELCASWGVRVSILVLASVKGSPGVTTTACLLGSTWPNADRIVVAECDPSGGDLSARFALSARQGWTSLAASIRRGASGPLGEHLQTLPGGLRVLIGSRDSSPDCARLSAHFLERGRQFTDGPWDIVADVGRIVRGERTQTSWLGVADRA